MSFAIDVINKMLKETEDKNSQLQEEYDNAKKAIEEMKLRKHYLSSIIDWKVNKREDPEAFKKHFEFDKIANNYSKKKKEFDAFEDDYFKKTQLNNEMLDYLNEIIKQNA
ncbi:hypothetical protein [Bacillus atrophaeus]|uniref:hypothetical protein n=1 Tax=Bacillus atrophaeus TaxID=1452 RepID=UPI0022819241|nr:hypothetical protein [Bacillus atrophaeus]MCY8947984.1 hypothetical protein [Bacillus atrophaeus]MCY8973586.1 hypothetical protein [Bacillus atrophaeus]